MGRRDSNLGDVKLYRADEFDKRFEYHYVRSKTYKEAYEMAEADFNAVFGENKYSSYESFRKSYNRRQG